MGQKTHLKRKKLQKNRKTGIEHLTKHYLAQKPRKELRNTIQNMCFFFTGAELARSVVGQSDSSLKWRMKHNDNSTLFQCQTIPCSRLGHETISYSMHFNATTSGSVFLDGMVVRTIALSKCPPSMLFSVFSLEVFDPQLMSPLCAALPKFSTSGTPLAVYFTGRKFLSTCCFGVFCVV